MSHAANTSTTGNEDEEQAITEAVEI